MFHRQQYWLQILRTLGYSRSTRSPFITFLSRRAQSGRTSFGKRMWFTESLIVSFIFCLLIVLFIHLYPIYYQGKQLNHFLLKHHSHFTCTPSLTLLSYATAFFSLDC